MLMDALERKLKQKAEEAIAPKVGALKKVVEDLFPGVTDSELLRHQEGLINAAGRIWTSLEMARLVDLTVAEITEKATPLEPSEEARMEAAFQSTLDGINASPPRPR